MSILLGLTILDSGVPLSMVCAVIGLAFALCLIAIVSRSSAGNEKMRQISAAVQEGAKAYLNRQVITISVIAAIIFVLLFIFKDHPTAIGFVVGAFCSLAAGFIGMRIAVIANVRTTQAATPLAHRCLAHRVQRRRGNRFARGRSCTAFRLDLLYARQQNRRT